MATQKKLNKVFLKDNSQNHRKGATRILLQGGHLPDTAFTIVCRPIKKACLYPELL